jgi:two-component system sensor histidine kinase UhpB
MEAIVGKQYGSPIRGDGGQISAAALAVKARPLRPAARDRRTAARGAAALARMRIEAREAERASIARDLHDELGAQIVALRLALAEVEHRLPAEAHAACGDALVFAGESLDTLCDNAHSLVAGLRAPAIGASLPDALRDYARRIARRGRLDIGMRLPQTLLLADDLAHAVFRIVQEALSNVVAHARARHAWLEVTVGADGVLTLVVSDDGRGLPAAPGRARDHRFGVAGMRERCTAFGGAFSLTSRSGGGSVVRARLPLTVRAGARRACPAS